MSAARPTLNDVAAAAGVSRSTVSLVIRDEGSISKRTREHVRRVMADIGYVYNRGAASIRGGGTRSIGVIAPDSANLFMAEFTAAFEQQMDSRGFTVFTCHSHEEPARQDSLVTALLERGIDAIVLMPALDSERQVVSLLRAIDVPVVIVVRPVPGGSFTFVGSDNRLGGSLATEHLLEHGCRTIGYLGGPAELSLRADRLSGVTNALAQSTAELILDRPSPPTGHGGRDTMMQLIAADVLPDGIICHNDSVAFGAYRALRDAAPHQVDAVRIIGFDDVVEAELWEPPLTTVSTNAQEVGQVAADMVTRCLDRETDIASVHIRPKLVIRSSCGEHGSESSSYPKGPDRRWN